MFGVYYKNDHLPGPCILFMDYNGWWAPLRSLYFSNSSQVLVSKHPESCIQEIISYYCPQCLIRYQEEEIKSYRYRCPSCFQCPSCFCNLAVLALNEKECALQCGMCNWNSGDYGLIGGDHIELNMSLAVIERESKNAELFHAVLKSLTQTEISDSHSRVVENVISSPGSSKNKGTFQDMRLHIAGHQGILYDRMAKDKQYYDSLRENTSKLDFSYIGVAESNKYSSLEQRLKQELRQSPLLADQLPIRMRLMTKRTLRCRQDVDMGKLSILVQPSTFPLDGDSSLSQRKKWWIKDSSAIHEIPNVVITKLPKAGELETGQAHIIVQITNPRDHAVDVFIRQYLPSEAVPPATSNGLETLIIKNHPFSFTPQPLKIHAHTDSVQVDDYITPAMFTFVPKFVLHCLTRGPELPVFTRILRRRNFAR